jgi:hypothetical protein
LASFGKKGYLDPVALSSRRRCKARVLIEHNKNICQEVSAASDSGSYPHDAEAEIDQPLTRETS